MRRILSIDGGGIKGVFPASFLAELEDEVGESIANYFDLIVGTSTGGIIALGLGLGLTAKEILRFYESEGPRIFKRTPFITALKQMGLAKYDSKPLKAALQNTFGDKLLGESSVRLVIPAMNLSTGEVHVFKTAHKEHFIRDYKESAVSVALGTAAAPTFFRAHLLDSGTPLIDGGIWANNPVGVAVVEAIGVLEWPRDQLKILSLGCTSSPLNIGKARRFSVGVGYWAPRIANIFMAGQSSQAMGTAMLLAGGGNVVRISPLVAPRYKLDGVNEVADLKGLGKTEASKAYKELREVFFSKHAEAFVPKRSVKSVQGE